MDLALHGDLFRIRVLLGNCVLFDVLFTAKIFLCLAKFGLNSLRVHSRLFGRSSVPKASAQDMPGGAVEWLHHSTGLVEIAFISLSNSLCYAHTAGLLWTSGLKSVSIHLSSDGSLSNYICAF